MLIKKNVLILHPADKSACAFYRCHAVAMLLNSTAGGDVEVIVSRAEITDEYVLKYTAAVVFFRVTTEQQATMVMHYKRNRRRFGFRIFCDYDDLVFDVGRFDRLPAWNPNPDEDLRKNAEVMKGALSDIDGITVTTEWLKGCMETRFGWPHVRILPNAVPRYCFGRNPRKRVDEDLVRPRVLYAGSTCHFSEGNPGDFAGPWIGWLRSAVERDEIELHLFQMPDFLAGLEDRVTVHGQTSAVEFPSVVASIEPHFYLAPLADNFFNRAKSNLKLLEATAVGAVLIASSFMWSPYEEAFPVAKVAKGDSETMLASRFKSLCEARCYNYALGWQRSVMDRGGLWMDSKSYLERWLRSWFGETLVVNG